MCYRVELDLLLCPDWNINAPAIIVYGANATNNLAFRHRFGDFLAIKRPSHSSCDCLLTVSIPIQYGEPLYSVWHILVTFDDQFSIEWVHVGEVRFPDLQRSRNHLTSIPTPKTTAGALSQCIHILRGQFIWVPIETE